MTRPVTSLEVNSPDLAAPRTFFAARLLRRRPGGVLLDLHAYDPAAR